MNRYRTIKMAEANTSVAANPMIPRNYWDFNPSQVTVGQLNPWLNYEFARSCRWLMQCVQNIRTGKGQETPSVFARFLAARFPEFPAKAWLEIGSKLRIERLRSAGIDPDADPFDRREEPIEIYDIHDVLDGVSGGEMCFSRSMTDEVYGVIKINFDHENSTIVKTFEAWLGKRRTELIKQYKDNPVGRENRNFFEPHTPPRQRGHGANQSQFRPWFKRLAALRLLQEMKWDSAADLTEEASEGHPLYSEKRAWTRAQQEAGDLLLRFTMAWKSRSFPFLLVPKRLHREVGLTGCGHPFLSNTRAWNQDNVEHYRERIRNLLAQETLSRQEIISF